MKYTKQEITEAVARGWCHEDTKHKVMDEELAYAIVDEIMDLLATKPAKKDKPKEIEKLSLLDVSWSFSLYPNYKEIMIEAKINELVSSVNSLEKRLREVENKHAV